jgi:hypothetical protein
LTGGVALLALIVVCSVAVLGAYLWLGLHRTNQAARIVPAQTSAFVCISPSLLQLPQLRNADNLVKGAAVLAALPGVLEAGEAIQDNFSLDDFDVDPKKDILPWIGREMSLAVLHSGRRSSDTGSAPGLAAPAKPLPGAYDGPPLVLAAATRNRSASDAFLAKLRSQMEWQGILFEETTYRGTEITEIVSPRGIPLAYATFNHLVVIATDLDTLRDSIDAAAEDDIPVLNDQEAFKDVLDDLPANRFGYMYLDWPALTGHVWEDLEALPMGGLQAIENVGVALSLASDGLRFDYVANYDLDALSQAEEELLRQSPNPHRLTDIAPADSLVYISGQNLPLVWETFEDSDLGETFREALQELEYTTGVHFVNDILDLMPGEYAWVLAPDPAGFWGDETVWLGFLLFIEADERALVERNLDDLASALSQDSDIYLYQDEINRVPVWLLEDRYEGTTLGYGFMGDFLFIGTSRDMIRLATPAENSSLADNELFRAAVKPLPGKSRGYVYVNVQQSVRTAYQAMDDHAREEFNTTARPYMESIRAISMAAEPMDKKGVLRGVLFVHTEAE